MGSGVWVITKQAFGELIAQHAYYSIVEIDGECYNVGNEEYFVVWDREEY